MLISFSFNKLCIWFIELVTSEFSRVLYENNSPGVDVCPVTFKL